MTSAAPTSGRRRWALAATNLLLLAALTNGQVFRAGNDASRWAQIESLVDLGERWIDHSQFAWTIDRVRIGEHLYSNKPPLLSLAGAGTYVAVRAALGGTLADPRARPRLVYLVTLLLVGGCASWLLVELDRSIDLLGQTGESERTLVLLAALCGTLLTSFATTLNNHTVAAFLLLAAWRAAFLKRGWRAGLFGGLAACVDIVPGAGMLPFLALELGGGAARRRELRGFAFAVAGTALLGAVADLVVVGHVLPPKLVPGAVDESAQVAESVAGVVLPQGWSYPLEALFGWRGFFSLSPVLLFGVAGLVASSRRAPRPGKESDVPPRVTARGARLLAMAIAVQIAFHVTVAGSFGGWSYGFRYLIPVVPLLLIFAPVAMTVWRRSLFAAALLPSVLVALLGAYNPWPPVFEQESDRHPVAAVVGNPVGGNAAAFLAQHFPESAVAAWAGERWISAEPAVRRSWLAYFFWSKGDVELARRHRR